MKKNVGANECGNCGALEQKKDTMQVCGRCHRVRYCARACQAAHWKGGHKRFCIDPKACDPKDQPKEDRGEVNCLICLGAERSTFEHACSALLHQACLAVMYAQTAEERPPCPACRGPLPNLDEILEHFQKNGEYDKCFELIHALPENWRNKECVAVSMVFNLACHLWKTGREDEALVQFQEFCKLDSVVSDLAKARHNMGQIYRKRKEYVSAEAEFRKAVEYEPANVAFLLQLGYVLMDQLTSLDMSPLAVDAMAVFNRCVELDPSHHRAIRCRGFFHFMAGDFSAALVDARVSISLAPDYDQAHLLCGRVLTALQQFPEAEAELLRGIELNRAGATGFGLLSNLYRDWANCERKAGRPYRPLCFKGLDNEKIYTRMKLADPSC